MNKELILLSEVLLEVCGRKSLSIATVESCTGGMLAAHLTAIPGSSRIVERGFVTYSDAAKTETVGVDPVLIQQNGAVSAAVAEAMALGGLEHAPVDLTAAITGVAGPGGGTTLKPVGLVYIAVANRDGAVEVRENHLSGDRAAVRSAAVQVALEMLMAAAESR
jgi:nicotinamide-nucleotide amidase